MRLHQPDRPLQPPQHVHRPRSRSARVFDCAVLDQWILVAACVEFAVGGLEWEEVSWIPVTFGVGWEWDDGRRREEDVC